MRSWLSVYFTDAKSKKEVRHTDCSTIIQLSNKMDNSLLAVRGINHKYIVVDGMTLIRGQEVPDGVFHLVCEIIVRHTDGTYLLMQRDHRKTKGGMWEATAGGSALRGEDPLTCALRELSEETGINADRLTEVGRVVHRLHKSIFVDYLCETDVDKNSVVLQEGETSAYKWVTAEELRAMNPDVLASQRILNFIENGPLGTGVVGHAPQ